MEEEERSMKERGRVMVKSLTCDRSNQNQLADEEFSGEVLEETNSEVCRERMRMGVEWSHQE